MCLIREHISAVSHLEGCDTPGVISKHFPPASRWSAGQHAGLQEGNAGQHGLIDKTNETTPGVLKTLTLFGHRTGLDRDLISVVLPEPDIMIILESIKCIGYRMKYANSGHEECYAISFSLVVNLLQKS